MPIHLLKRKLNSCAPWRTLPVSTSCSSSARVKSASVTSKPCLANARQPSLNISWRCARPTSCVPAKTDCAFFTASPSLTSLRRSTASAPRRSDRPVQPLAALHGFALFHHARAAPALVANPARPRPAPPDFCSFRLVRDERRPPTASERDRTRGQITRARVCQLQVGGGARAACGANHGCRSQHRKDHPGGRDPEVQPPFHAGLRD